MQMAATAHILKIKTEGFGELCSPSGFGRQPIRVSEITLVGRKDFGAHIWGQAHERGLQRIGYAGEAEQMDVILCWPWSF
jgi:hypothetical protein